MVVVVRHARFVHERVEWLCAFSSSCLLGGSDEEKEINVRRQEKSKRRPGCWSSPSFYLLLEDPVYIII